MNAQNETYDQALVPGKCIISKTQIQDPRFIMTVSLLCHHDEEGSFALTLNRPTTLYLDPLNFSLCQQKEKHSFHPVFIGGPVQPENMFFLFRHTEELPDSKKIFEDIYLCSSPDTYKELERMQTLTPSNIRFFLGYAGWSFFQLDCEASDGSWYVNQALRDYVFYPIEDNLWLTALKDLGENFHQIGLDFLKSFGND